MGLENKLLMKNNIEVSVPQLKISLNREIEISNWNCKYQSDLCNKIFNDLTNTFGARIFSFEDGKYFDQPSAYRLLGGLAITYNNLV